MVEEFSHDEAVGCWYCGHWFHDREGYIAHWGGVRLRPRPNCLARSTLLKDGFTQADCGCWLQPRVNASPYEENDLTTMLDDDLPGMWSRSDFL